MNSMLTNEKLSILTTDIGNAATVDDMLFWAFRAYCRSICIGWNGTTNDIRATTIITTTKNEDSIFDRRKYEEKFEK